jgi:hypothetical protein
MPDVFRNNSVLVVLKTIEAILSRTASFIRFSRPTEWPGR